MSEFLRNSSPHNAPGAEEQIQRHMGEISERDDRELAEDFMDWFDSVSEENFDEKLLDAFLKEIAEQEALDFSFHTEESLEKFHKKYPLFLADCDEGPFETKLPEKGSGRRSHSFFRRVVLIAATVAFLFASIVTAHAFGVDVFRFFARWTDEYFLFSGERQSAQESQKYPFAEGESAEFDRIDQALETFNIQISLVPQWFPEGMDHFDVVGAVTGQGMEIFAFSQNGEQTLSFSISDFDPETGPLFLIEKDEEDVCVYEAGGNAHYLLKDNTLCKTTWIVGNIQCILSGDVTEEEMKKMIDSIYEVA